MHRNLYKVFLYQGKKRIGVVAGRSRAGHFKIPFK